MDIGAVVLHKLIEDQSLEAWTKLRASFFSPAYKKLYGTINRYYTKHNSIPSFEDLEASTRSNLDLKDVTSLKLLETPEIELDLALDILLDQYTQNEALLLLDRYIDQITIKDSEEIKTGIAEIALKLDEKTHTDETVATMNSITLFKAEEDTEGDKFPTGINNTYDNNSGGAYRQELIMIGGKRGAGKSIVSANLVANQYEMGNTSLYFTIEMTAQETFERISSIISGVPYASIRQNDLSSSNIIELVRMRSNMFIDGEEYFDQFLEHNDPIKFEKTLVAEGQLKEDNQIIIIDDRELSLSTIDLHLQKAKAQFGDKLTLVVVDYVNQVQTGMGDSMYDWQPQIYAAKKLKEFARKYDIALVSPYQISDDGKTRFAKGLLDSPDQAFLLEAHNKEDGCVTFTSTKSRSGPEFEFTSAMNWETLKIGPQDKPKPENQKEVKEDIKTSFKKQSDDLEY